MSFPFFNSPFFDFLRLFRGWKEEIVGEDEGERGEGRRKRGKEEKKGSRCWFQQFLNLLRDIIPPSFHVSPSSFRERIS